MTLTYQIALSLHIVSVIAWMAGLLYLFRLFVYHAEETEQVVKERFKVMEERLYRIITVPAMVSSFVFGLSLVAIFPPHLRQGWLHAKLLFVFLLVGVTFMGGQQVRKLSRDVVPYGSRTYRILNEVPTLLMIFIVFLVVLKPFMG